MIGAILAGGQSARMGRPKAGIPIPGGLTLGETALRALAAICDHVVALGHGEGLPAALPRLPDRRPGEGPVAGLEALLLSGLGDAYLVCPCDLPRLSALDLIPLARALQAGHSAAAFADPGPRGVLHLPLALTPGVAPQVVAYLDEGRRSVGGLLARLDPHILPLPPGALPRLAGANTPEELAAALGSAISSPLGGGS